MAQKAHPTILRPAADPRRGSAYWDEPKFYYQTSTIQKLIESCCLGTNHYLNKIRVDRHLGYILVEVDLIHLHLKSKRRFKSRRDIDGLTALAGGSWVGVACRLRYAMQLVQQFSGTKRVTLKIHRLKAYTRAIPKPARRRMSYFGKAFNRSRYDYARYGLQLIYLILKGRANANSFARFLEQNINSRQKRKRHYQFLAYIKQALRALEPYKQIQGLKIQIKGRFTQKAKGRSRTWKHQIGAMPMSQLDKNIDTKYIQTHTAYGSVGIKVWVCL